MNRKLGILACSLLLALAAAGSASSRRQPHVHVVLDRSSGDVLEGAHVYADNCAVCHGFKGQPKTAVAKGMYPPPPQLLQGKGVTDDPPGETFWVVKNGIRLTGMPEFKHILNETEMWQVSLLLAKADKISDAVKQQLQPPPPPVGVMPPGAPGNTSSGPTKPTAPPPTR